MNANIKNIKGQKFGRLTVLEISENERRGAYWLCECECGEQMVAYGASLRRGSVKSCGCLIKDCTEARSKALRRDVAGERYGMLLALSFSHSSGKKQGAYWLFRCACGTEKALRLKDVRHGNTASCGCMQFVKNGIDTPRPWASSAATH